MLKKSKFLIPGIILVAAMLRIPFTTIPSILTEVAAGLNVSVSSLGTLTTIPLLMFALVSSFAPKLAQRIGIEWSFSLVLFLMAVGSFIRTLSVPTLYLGTAMIGAGIAVLNVLMPSIVTAYFPHKIGQYTTLYTTSMGISAAVASSLAVPITQASSWKTLILVLTVLICLSFVVWLPNVKFNHKLSVNSNQKTTSSFWKNKVAWVLLIFGGFQSMLFYTGLTWLPTMASNAGLSHATAGTLSGVYSLISLPLSMFLPNLVAHVSAKLRRTIMGGFCLLGIIGIAALFFQQASFGYWLLINCLIGASVGALFPYLMTTFSLKTTDPHKTAKLSGMAQTGGYLLAAVGPFLFGYGFEIFHSWTFSIACLLLASIAMTACMLYVERFDKIG